MDGQTYGYIRRHGRIWSPFHPFPGRGWRRSQNCVGHKMRRGKKRKEKIKEERRKNERIREEGMERER